MTETAVADDPGDRPEQITYETYRGHYRRRMTATASVLAALVRRFPEVGRRG